MKLDVYKVNGKISGEKVTLNPDVFDINPNEHVVYLAVKAHLAKTRQGTNFAKTRSDIAGGGKKPFRQKGTGRARQGTTRAAQMVGGGKAHGPVPRDYTQSLPKKVLKLAKKSALSSKARDQRIVVIEDFSFEEPKSKRVAEILEKLKIETSKVMFVTTEVEKNIVLSARNIPYTRVHKIPEFSVYDLLNAQYLIFQKGAVQKANEVLV
jgi:large subunit ribosomal protein L4